MKNQQTLKMVQTAILLAIILLMFYTPLGYLKIGPLSITLLSIPVGIGAMLIGPGAGAFLGLAFGLTSCSQGFTGQSALGVALIQISPIYYIINTVGARVLMGWLCGVLFKAVKKVDKTKTVCFFVGGFLSAFLNTVFFMGCLILFFWNSDVIQGFNQALGNLSPLPFVFAFVGVNGALEWPAACIIGGIVSKAVTKALPNS